MSEGSSFKAGQASTAGQKTIPQRIEPRKFVAQSVLLEGVIPAQGLTRLAEASAKAETVTAVLDFVYDEERRRVVKGTVEASLTLTCQRCLEPMPFNTSVSINWAVVWDEEQAKNLPARLDPWIAGEESEDLYAMVEEELLLAIPTAPMHEELCIEASLLSSGDEIQQDVSETTNNPFQALAALKGKTKH